jgi:hypothetical protein
MPESLTPWEKAATASSRSASLDAAGWRISTISTSLISLRAHWMAPMPISSSAIPRVAPSATLEAP